MSKYNDLLDRLIEYTNSDFVPMHMPGAKRNETIYEGGEALSKLDITEIDGFDNLHNSEGILLDIKKKAQRLYNSKESLLLVNGSTAGILAAISGVCNKNDSIIIARNCHVSVYNAIYINELDPEYIIPQMDENTGILKGITLNEVVNAVDKAIALNKKPRAVVITSPTYEGIVSEIKEIADYLHEKEIVLIVDEAHGAHFQFSDKFPESAVKLGADIVINSIHKTLPAPTQTAIMHLNSDLINYDKVKRYWNIYQSTSPSYLLMAGIDRALSFIDLDGEKAYKEYCDNLIDLRAKISKLNNISLVEVDDISKIVLKGNNIIENFGKWLYDKLLEEYKIQLEMASFEYAIAMTAVGDLKEYYDRFIEALEEIDKEIDKEIDSIKKRKIEKYNANNRNKGFSLEDMVSVNKALKPSETIKLADEGKSEFVSLKSKEVINRVSVNAVLLYPPGMPIVNSGEIITKEKAEILINALENNIEVMGLNEDLISVIKENYEV